MTKEAQSKYIVEKLIELSCKGVEIRFNEHMEETVVEWTDFTDSTNMRHAHVDFFNGERGVTTSLVQILAAIEQDYEKNK